MFRTALHNDLMEIDNKLHNLEIRTTHLANEKAQLLAEKAALEESLSNNTSTFFSSTYEDQKAFYNCNYAAQGGIDWENLGKIPTYRTGVYRTSTHYQ